MTTTVYTIGYSGRKPAEVKQIIEDLDAILLDIRFSPRSRLPQWAGSNVKALVGADNYRHMKALGNVNYKGGPVEIVDYQAGRDTIESLDRPVVLMCVCGDAATCHRTTVAGMLRADGFTVTEIDHPHHSEPKPVKPAKPTSLVSQLALF